MRMAQFLRSMSLQEPSWRLTPGGNEAQPHTMLVLAAAVAVASIDVAIGLSISSPTPYDPAPVIHFTPPCYKEQGGWHDTAGAMRHPETGLWHVFVGPVWQHLTTENLVDWTVAGNAAVGGGSGTVIFDAQHNVTVAVTGTTSGTTTADPGLGNFSKQAFKMFHASDPVGGGGCWDPVVWWDERDRTYYGMAACGHNRKGMTGPGGYGVQIAFSSPALTGPAMNWTLLKEPFLEWRRETVPQVGVWNRSHEFVTPDFFPLPGGDAWGFLTTSYGGLLQTRLNVTAADGLREYDYSNYLLGPRPAPGTAFAPDDALSGPFDWSPFQPAADPSSRNLTFATSKGMEQFGCCPKTAGDADRRVLFGWINNGWDQGPGEPDRTGAQANHNTLSLPRDLSLTPAGQMRQRFVPELRSLRQGSGTRLESRALPAGGVSAAQFVAGAEGLQIEVLATFSIDPTKAKGRFGLLVLAATDRSEFVAIAFDATRGHFMLDRSMEGQSVDADVRAGPWPETGTTTVTVHAYVDHAVVEMIANATGTAGSEGCTAIAAWVAPTTDASAGVALFAESPGVTLDSLEVWQLASPTVALK